MNLFPKVNIHITLKYSSTVYHLLPGCLLYVRLEEPWIKNPKIPQVIISFQTAVGF